MQAYAGADVQDVVGRLVRDLRVIDHVVGGVLLAEGPVVLAVVGVFDPPIAIVATQVEIVFERCGDGPRRDRRARGETRDLVALGHGLVAGISHIGVLGEVAVGVADREIEPQMVADAGLDVQVEALRHRRTEVQDGAEAAARDLFRELNVVPVVVVDAEVDGQVVVEQPLLGARFHAPDIVRTVGARHRQVL